MRTQAMMARASGRGSMTPLSRLTAAVAATVMLACGDGRGPFGPQGPAPVASVTVVGPQHSLRVGNTVTIQATLRDADGNVLTGRSVSWRSSDAAVAAVSAAGVLEAKGPGSATITASSESREGTATIGVTIVPVSWVNVTPELVELAWDGTRQLAATSHDSVGGELSGRAVVWTSSNAAVATVSADGTVTARGPGVASVRATSAENARFGVAQISVGPAPVARVVLASTDLALEPGDALGIHARVESPTGAELPHEPVTWTTSNAAVASVDQASGRITAHSAGTTAILATAGGKTALAIVRVAPTPGFDLIYSRPLSTGGSEIFTLSLADASRTPVKLNAGNVSRDPSASPDGARFVFAVSQIDLTTGASINDLFAVDVNGMNMKRLTTSAGIDEDPAWSPDGRKIAYAGTNPVTQSQDIYVMNADGTGAVSLTEGMGVRIEERQPAWSADGQWIAFSASTGVTNVSYRIWVMRADGSEKRQVVTSDVGFDMAPTWSPDGGRIAFQRYGSAQQTGADIMIVDAAGGAPARLALPGDQYFPTWSPDGAHIAYMQHDTLGYNIWTVRPDGSGERMRTRQQWGGGVAPSWIRRQ